VAVLGLGRFGTALALELVARGTEVLALDASESVVQSLSARLPRVIAVDTTDLAALRQLGLSEYRRAVVAVGTDVEVSILTTSHLVELEVPDIWAKAISGPHARILERVGARHVVLPEHEMGERVAHLLSDRILDYVRVDDDYAMVKTRPPRDLVGVPLGETKVTSRYGVTVVSAKSQAFAEDGFVPVTPDTVLMYGDVVLVVGSVDAVERFAEAV
jgi:trk system potassium uptake protein TrkA